MFNKYSFKINSGIIKKLAVLANEWNNEVKPKQGGRNMKKMICFSIGAFFLSLCLSLAANAAGPRVMKSPTAATPSTPPAAVISIPAPEVGLAPVLAGTTNVTINWTYSSNVTINGFKVERKVGNGSYGTPVDVSSSARFYAEEAPPASDLTYRIRAYKVVSGQEYYSSYSPEMKITTGGVKPQRYKIK